MSKPITILFLAANPSNETRLALGREHREIEDRIRRGVHRDALRLESRWAVRPDDLQEALLEHQPHIVHFSGHGSSANELILEDDTGHGRPVSGPALGDLFRVLRDNVRLVLLNACFSLSQARAIATHIDFVVGMSRAISDEAAIAFATAFYRGIAYGRSVRTAFDLGINALQVHGIPEDKTPQLLVREGADAGTLLTAPRGHAELLTSSPDNTSGTPPEEPAREAAPAATPAPAVTLAPLATSPATLEPGAAPPQSMPPREDQQPDEATGSRQIMVGVWVFGGLLLVFFVYVFVFAPDALPAYKQRMLGLSLALLAGLMGWFLAGSLLVHFGGDANLASSPTRRRMPTIQGVGGMGLFVLVLVWWWSPWSPIDVEPTPQVPRSEVSPPVPPDARVAEPPDGPHMEHTMADVAPISSPDARRLPVAALPDARQRSDLGSGLAKPMRWTVTQTELLGATDAIPKRIYFEGPALKPGTILILQRSSSAGGRHFVGETRCRVDGPNTCMLSPVKGNPALEQGDVLGLAYGGI